MPHATHSNRARLTALLCATLLLSPLPCGCAFREDEAATAPVPEAPAGPTQEEMRRELTTAAESFMGTTASVDADKVASVLRENDDVVFFEGYGFDVDAYAQRFAQTTTIRLVSVDIGDGTGVATFHLDVFNLSDRFNEVFDQKMATLDVASMTDDEAIALAASTYNELVASPDAPLVTYELPVTFLWDGKSWHADDPDAISSVLESLTL